MNEITAFFLGIVQGLTEFLPISSSGHLVLFERLLHLDSDGGLSFEIAVHFATLISVLAVMWREIWYMIRNPFSKLTIMIVVATVPTVVIGLVFKDWIESLFASGSSLGIEFILTGFILLWADSIAPKPGQGKDIKDMSLWNAGLIGTCQGIAIFPAISRSGLTLAGGLFSGFSREFALKFSFLLSIPSILGPALLDAVKMVKGGVDVTSSIPLSSLLIGMLAAAVSGYIAVRFMLKVFSTAKLKVFSYYVFALGFLILIDQLFFQLFFPALF